MSATATGTTSRGTAGKLERIRQLAEHGLNTPRITRIAHGSTFDNDLRSRLRDAAEGAELMTVRTYHPTDEITYARGPFAPEIPVERAIQTAEDFSHEWHVLFQEAIDVADTVLAGNILLSRDGSGRYEALAGRFRVRDVEQPPPEAQGALRRGDFSEPGEIGDPDVRELVRALLSSGLLDDVTEEADDRVVVEFNVQSKPVGALHDRTLLWEWRPVAGNGQPPADPGPPVVEDGDVYGVGVGAVPSAPVENGDAGRLGGKGWALAKAESAALPVPPALIFSVPPGEVPADPPESWARPLPVALEALATASGGRRLAVRSSPTVSMPGMLDTFTDVAPEMGEVVAAIERVLASWWSERAVAYRRNRGLESARLAVVVQAFVDGRTDAASGTGVAFTRNPDDGASKPVLEYLPAAQGDDLVGGRSTPAGVDEMRIASPEAAAIVSEWPAALERLFRDMQELEFTIESGRPFLLQSRAGKRSRAARVRIAHDLLAEGVVDEDEARDLLHGLSLRDLASHRLDTGGATTIAEARVAAHGAAAGRIALGPETVAKLRAAGDPVILISDTSDPAHYPLFSELVGIVTHLGGVTSHAAVAALEAEIVALVGTEPLQPELDAGRATFGTTPIAEGDWISIEGAETGRVFAGKLPVVSGELPSGLTPEIFGWAQATLEV